MTSETYNEERTGVKDGNWGTNGGDRIDELNEFRNGMYVIFPSHPGPVERVLK